jgi:hypothetical protein
MKKKVCLTGIFSIILIFGMLVVVGCDNGTTDNGNGAGGNDYGAITIINNSNQYNITYVEVYDVSTDETVFYEFVTIARGSRKTFDQIDPGDRLKVYIEDSGEDYMESLQFSLRAGGSKTLTYDGLSLN